MQNIKSDNAHHTIYLCAPVNALIEGIFEENIHIGDVKKHGDFGLGTFNQLDGEMIVLDGKVYQITGDGRVHTVDDDTETPFVCVTFFQTHNIEQIDHQMTYPEFLDYLLNLLPSKNIFYAIRIQGLFKSVKVRSVPKQESYHPLIEVVANQPIFEFEHIEGTLAGFFTPDFMASLNVPGLHLHFLSKDLQHGGHLLECTPHRMRVGVQYLNNLELSLPLTREYLNLNFQRNIAEDIDKIEK